MIAGVLHTLPISQRPQHLLQKMVILAPWSTFCSITSVCYHCFLEFFSNFNSNPTHRYFSYFSSCFPPTTSRNNVELPIPSSHSSSRFFELLAQLQPHPFPPMPALSRTSTTLLICALEVFFVTLSCVFHFSSNLILRPESPRPRSVYPS